MGKYKVEVLKYPEEVEVEANSIEEAKEIAKSKVDFSVWSFENIELIEEN